MEKYTDEETGYTVYKYSYEDWEAGSVIDPPHPGKQQIPLSEDLKSIIIREFSKDTFDMIRKRQREIFDSFVNQKLESLKGAFNKYYAREEALERKRYLLDEIQTVENLLFPEKLDIESGRLKANTSPDFKLGNWAMDKKLIQIIRTFVKLQFERGIVNVRFIPANGDLGILKEEYRQEISWKVEARAYYFYLQDLKSLLNRDRSRKSKKGLTFLELFKNDRQRLDKFWELIKSVKVQAIDNESNWVFNSRKSSIVACFKALEDCGIIKPNVSKALLRRTIESEISFSGSERLFRNPINTQDYEEFYNLFKKYL